MEYQVVKEKHRYVILDKTGKYEINLAERIFNFVIKILQFSKKIPKSNINDIVVSHLTKAATSLGANYEEAQDTSNTTDFAGKISIALLEGKVTNYWLRVIKASEIDYGLELDSLIMESAEFRNILSNIAGKVRSSRHRA
jgi:four helix bundle protein